MERLIELRAVAHKAGNFEEADRIRDQSAAEGVILEDQPAVAPLIAWWDLDPRCAPRGPGRPGPNRARIAALEQLKCDSWLLVLDQARRSANPLAVLRPETRVAC